MSEPLPHPIENSFSLLRRKKLTYTKKIVYHLLLELQLHPCKVTEHLINLKGIGILRGITYDKAEGLKIGALTTIGDIERDDVVKDKYRMLWDAVKVMAGQQVRNLGTIGGNLSSAAPIRPSLRSGFMRWRWRVVRRAVR